MGYNGKAQSPTPRPLLCGTSMHHPPWSKDRKFKILLYIVGILDLVSLSPLQSVSMAKTSLQDAYEGTISPPLSAQAQRPLRLAGAKKNGKSKVAKKKTKSTKIDDFGPMDVAPVSRQTADIGIGVHREQEGVDRPYSVEIAGNSIISSLKKDDSLGDSTSGTLVDTIVEATMVTGFLQVGLEIQYKSLDESTAAKPNATPPTEATRLSEVKLGGGPVVKANFGSLDTSLNVPFVYGGISYLIDEIKPSKGQNRYYSGNTMRLGGGVHLFLDSNVTFAPKIEYFNETLNGSGSQKITRKGPRALFQFALFL